MKIHKIKPINNNNDGIYYYESNTNQSTGYTYYFDIGEKNGNSFFVNRQRQQSRKNIIEYLIIDQKRFFVFSKIDNLSRSLPPRASTSTLSRSEIISSELSERPPGGMSASMPVERYANKSGQLQKSNNRLLIQQTILELPFYKLLNSYYESIEKKNIFNGQLKIFPNNFRITRSGIIFVAFFYGKVGKQQYIIFEIIYNTTIEKFYFKDMTVKPETIYIPIEFDPTISRYIGRFGNYLYLFGNNYLGSNDNFFVYRTDKQKSINYILTIDDSFFNFKQLNS
jgi:hypothetical protein